MQKKAEYDDLMSQFNQIKLEQTEMYAKAMELGTNYIPIDYKDAVTFIEATNCQNVTGDKEIETDVIDGINNTKWCSYYEEGANPELVIKFARPIYVSGYGFQAANDHGARDPGKWTLYFQIPNDCPKPFGNLNAENEFTVDGQVEQWPIPERF